MQPEEILYGSARATRRKLLPYHERPPLPLDSDNTGTASGWFKDKSGWLGTDNWTARSHTLPAEFRPAPGRRQAQSDLKLTQYPLRFFDTTVVDFIARVGALRGQGLQTVELLYRPAAPDVVLLHQYQGDELLLVPLGLEVSTAHLAAVETIRSPGSWIFDPRQQLLYLKEAGAGVISGMVRCR